MVQAVRSGRALRAVAAEFRVSVGAVAFWVKRASGQRLDRVSWANRRSGKAWNRTAPAIEQRILGLRVQLRDRSVLGEYGAEAISAALRAEGLKSVPSRATVHRVLARHGVLDGVRRRRRPPPPKGWYLPNVAKGQAELDSFDFIEDLKIADGPLVSVLTAISLHGALSGAALMEQRGAQATLQVLIERWRRDGLPDYAQFDNDTIFQGAHQFADTVGRISRLCLALGIVPVFVPPREPGFQNAIEGFNALWQAKVWSRTRHPDFAHLVKASKAYIGAHRAKTVARREHAPERQPFPRRFSLDLDAPLHGTMIFLRRSNEYGHVQLLGRSFLVHEHWSHRLARCEVDFTHQRLRFYGLRRREPHYQPLLRELPYHRTHKPFQGMP